MNAIAPTRGLTLVEVLVATALLAMLSAMCASLLRDVQGRFEDATNSPVMIDPLELDRFADSVLEEGEFESIFQNPDPVSLSLIWSECVVQVNSVETTSAVEAGNHRWLAFECRGLIVWRSVPIVRSKSIP